MDKTVKLRDNTDFKGELVMGLLSKFDNRPRDEFGRLVNRYFQPYRGKDIANIPTPAPVVRGRFLEESFSLVVGESGVGKTFFALSLALSLTTGQDKWLGADIPKERRVAYLIPEGFGRVKYRIYAWLQWAKESGLIEDDQEFPGGLTLLRESLELYDDGANSRVNQFIEQFSGPRDHPHVVILDTLQRHGYPEAGDERIRIALDNIGRIQRECQCMVLGVHHTPKSGALTPRGGGQLDATADTVLLLSGDGKKQPFKGEFQQRDLEPSELAFERIPWTLSGANCIDPDNHQSITSCVTVPVYVEPSTKDQIVGLLRSAELAGMQSGAPFEGHTLKDLQP